MKGIEMIRIEQLMHHPENPRKDLGDLSELTDSIRQNGVMQNLTVVAEDDHYLVVIGNRRLEAAKAAGLTELPCVISDMDHKTQISTMLMENMQRQDLTVYEQAQGFQMMMDLGMTEAEIGEITGFSRTTVKRRVKMAELDQETLEKVSAQLTMDDLDKLAKIRDIDERNKLLKEAGTSNFKWKTENAIKEQLRDDNYKQVRAILLQAGCVEKSTDGIQNFWRDYQYLSYENNVNLDTYKPGQNVLPEDNRQLYFCKEWGSVKFWAEKRKEEPEEDEEPSEEDIAKREAEEKARKAWNRLEEIEKHADESRCNFLRDMNLKQKDSRKALEWLIIAMTVSNNLSDWVADLIPDHEEDEIKELPEGHSEVDLDLKDIRTAINECPTLYADMMGTLFFEGEDSISSRWRRSEEPEYCRNVTMITGYEWLEAFGYEASDDERAYLDGTLDCFKGRCDE